jgi:hypothetical protein
LHSGDDGDNKDMNSKVGQSEAQEHSEGILAKTIEEQTAKLPSDTFLWLAIGSMVASATFKMAGKSHEAVFVGQWAPAFLLFGIYNKLVKQLGSDRVTR